MITPQGFAYDKFNFPCGEMHIKVTQAGDAPALTLAFEKNEDIIELLLVCDALKRLGKPLQELVIPYVPFGRQDRVAVPGECFSLKVFANLVNQCQVPRVVVTDPHSEVTTALLDNCQVIKQGEVFAPLLADKKEFYLVSPDAGAMKKIHDLAARCPGCIDIVECSKLRNIRTGALSGVRVHADDLGGKDCYIVDDICDGGRTFIEVAKILRQKNSGKITLLVTHGFFTKGLQVFDGLIDAVYTAKGKIK